MEFWKVKRGKGGYYGVSKVLIFWEESVTSFMDGPLLVTMYPFSASPQMGAMCDTSGA